MRDRSALTGTTVSDDYIREMKHLGVNTNPDSTFTGGIGSGAVLQMGLGGLVDAGIGADAGIATAITGTGAPEDAGVAAGTAGRVLTPAVIGEGMGSRVIPYAEERGYLYYSGVENPENYTSEELLAHNRAQIETWVAEGRPVIDIGPEPGRAFYPMATSPNYAMEQNILRGYAGYSTDVLPGKTDWWTAIGH
jgi:hypothetical protein